MQLTSSIKHNTQFVPTTKKNSVSNWTKLITSIDELNQDQIVAEITNQLQKDMKNMQESKQISDCGVCAPRVGSHYDKKYMLAKNIAQKLFPSRTLCEKGTNWSRMMYARALRDLTLYFNNFNKSEFNKIIEIKKKRMIEGNGAMCMLKKRPVSYHIQNPTPMEVKVSEFEDLKPFFSFLASNKEIVPNTKEKSIVIENCMKFQKGAVYTDGRMDLCKQVVGSDWIENLMDSLVTNDKIKHFLLGNNIIDTRGAKAVAKFILNKEKKPTIETWYLAGNCINSEGIKYITDALKTDTNVKSLWLKRNPLKPEGIKYIAELLKVNNSIKLLDLHNTAVYDEGVEYLVDGLIENKSLRHLYLDANNITETGIVHFAKYFSTRKEKGIISLWIDMNFLYDNGAKILITSLKDYSFMKRFVIGSSGMTAESGKYLYETFKDSKTLECLDIGMYKSSATMETVPNMLGDDGISYIAQLIAENKSIKVLVINYNRVTEKGITMIADAIQKNDTLLFFYYVQFGLQVPQKENSMIVNKLKENMKKANIDPNNVDISVSRYIKHPKLVRYIDSIYRNKD